MSKRQKQAKTGKIDVYMRFAKRLSQRQITAAIAFVEAGSFHGAERKTGIQRESISFWMREDTAFSGFVAYLNCNLIDELYQGIIASTKDIGKAYASALKARGKGSGWLKLRAADSLSDRILKYEEREVLLREIKRLEAFVAGSKADKDSTEGNPEASAETV